MRALTLVKKNEFKMVINSGKYIDAEEKSLIIWKFRKAEDFQVSIVSVWVRIQHLIQGFENSLME